MEKKKILNKLEHIETMLNCVKERTEMLKNQILIDMLKDELSELKGGKTLDERVSFLEELCKKNGIETE